MAGDVATSAHPTPRLSDLDWLLGGLVQRVPFTRSAVLLTADGLVTCVHGLDPDSADHLAALASGLHALGRSAGHRFGQAAEVRQVVVELDSLLLFVSAAGAGTCLAVLADREADAGVLGYEMAMLVKSVRPYLAAPPRRPLDPQGEAVVPDQGGAPAGPDRSTR
ncbi:roadblock/LC7 domain-containing protein [Streptomyces sp. BI20]|uniref:roadblock/LC7 domain-containing protein n=1 Tax=Streptomyces sp. BI20 TaxID=3403460 RepID=UPI003C77B258